MSGVSRARLAVLALVVAMLTQCECPSSRTWDAGADGAVQDAGRDAGRDARRDGGRDGGDRDAGTGAWMRLPGIPDACDIFMAVNPPSVHARLRFEPCAALCANVT